MAWRRQRWRRCAPLSCGGAFRVGRLGLSGGGGFGRLGLDGRMLGTAVAASALGGRRGLVLVGLRFAELCVCVALSGGGSIRKGHGLGRGLRGLAAGYSFLRQGFYPALVGRTVCGGRL